MNRAVLAPIVACALLLSSGCASQLDRRWENQKEQLAALGEYLPGVWEADAGALPATLAPESEPIRVTLLPLPLRPGDETNETADYAVIQPQGAGPAKVVPYWLDASFMPEERPQLRIGDHRYEIEAGTKVGELTLRPTRGGGAEPDEPITLRAVEAVPSFAGAGRPPATDHEVHRKAFGER